LARVATCLLLLLMASAASTQSLAPRELERVFAFAEFDDPLLLTHAGDGSRRLFAVERPGRIKVIDPTSQTEEIFLDHRATVNGNPGEGGLLGLAFHPDFATNGRVFISYTFGNLVSRVSEMAVSDDPDQLDTSTERVILELSQPASNHNGGMILFGPDGMLYVGLGDGGAANDRYMNGQDPTTLLGTILRLDVDRVDAGLSYAIPHDNPFVGNTDGWREEIWAWGLRNPWRFSFDRVTGDLWAGDVGQGSFEEIDLVVRGGNYGWNIQEGFGCFRGSNCQRGDLLLPVLQYGRSHGVSVTGGYVYRGQRLGDLYGAYVYGDFGSGSIWAIRHDGTAITDSVRLVRSPSNISSFGEDEAGELYVVGYDGWIYRFLPLPGEQPVVTAVLDDVARETLQGSSFFQLQQSYPNPFNPTTTIRYALAQESAAQITVFDILGRRVRTLVSGWHVAGQHQVLWHGNNDSGHRVAPGVYLYRLETEDGITTRRMVLLK
jgi:glucose/arabinose dehydrogenase